jgi:hypothetical protein
MEVMQIHIKLFCSYYENVHLGRTQRRDRMFNDHYNVVHGKIFRDVLYEQSSSISGRN